MRPPAQVLAELLDALATLLAAEVTPVTQAHHNVEELVAENTRMAAERAILDAQAQRIQEDSFWLTLDQNVSNKS